MTRIMRLRIPISDEKEWISVIPGADPDNVLVVRQNGEEVVVGIEADEPIEPQLSRKLTGRTLPD